jgi:mannose-6-phosphate isomerase-like protein (cupin superfamily)
LKTNKSIKKCLTLINLHVNIEDISGEELRKGLIERVLLRDDQSIPGGFSARHYTIQSGEIVFKEPTVEYQHYIIAGCALFGGRIIHSESAIFVPGSQKFDEPRKHRFMHMGESELRILTLTYRIPRPNHRWAKTRIKNLYEVNGVLGNMYAQQLFTEEEHALIGALRFHSFDIQTHSPGIILPEHKNPEEIAYILRGRGEISAENSCYKVRPGSLVYTPEGVPHSVKNTSNSKPLQYIATEFIRHEKMWSYRTEK